jgi:hypothetical protein
VLICECVTEFSAEAGAAVGLAEVGAFHFYDAAHLVKAGAHALTNPVAESFASG